MKRYCVHTQLHHRMCACGGRAHAVKFVFLRGRHDRRTTDTGCRAGGNRPGDKHGRGQRLEHRSTSTTAHSAHAAPAIAGTTPRAATASASAAACWRRLWAGVWDGARIRTAVSATGWVCEWAGWVSAATTAGAAAGICGRAGAAVSAGSSAAGSRSGAEQ